MDDSLNAMIDIIVLILLLSVGSQFLMTSYNIIDKKVTLERREDKTAIKNYTGNVLSSDPNVTYEYTSPDILLMSAIQDMHNPNNRVITVSNNKRSNFANGMTPTAINMVFDTGYSGLVTGWNTEDMTGGNYLTSDRKSFIQQIWLNSSIDGYIYDYGNHTYEKKTTSLVASSGQLHVKGFRDLLQFSNPNKRWNLYLVKDTKIPGMVDPADKGGNYVWCVIQPQ